MERTNGPPNGAGPGPIWHGAEAGDETPLTADGSPRLSTEPGTPSPQGQSDPPASATPESATPESGEPEEAGPVLDTGPYAPDEEALRGTRFEFGGRRPYSFAPPRVAQRGPQRPLPGIGTVALGRVVRVAPYGAFVDFLGFRGLVHISQLMPGYRIERVEDVVNVGDEVVVRIIAVDPERRHINLALVPNSAAADTAPAPPAHAASRPLPATVAITPPMPTAEAASQPAAPAVLRAATVPPPMPAAVPAATVPGDTGPTPEAQAPSAGPSPAPPSPAPVPRPVAPVSAAVQRLPTPAPSAARPTPPRPTTAPAASGDRQQPRPAPKPQVSKHASRAVRRELEASHPMARLLATAGEDALHPERHKARYESERATPPSAGPASAAPETPKPTGVPELRQVHVSEPEPEPEEEQPATLEALAARFGPRAGTPSKEEKVPASRASADRSRQEREKQAAILARLRQNSGA